MTETADKTPTSEYSPAGRRPPSWVEVDLDAVRHNVQSVLRATRGRSPNRAAHSISGSKAQGNPVAVPGLIAVVKANAYGHGAVAVARAAVEGGAAALAVASLAEGAQLRQAGLSLPVLVLAAGDPEGAEEIVRLGLTQTLCTGAVAQALSRAAEHLGQPARVHIKIDSGMGRLGLRPEDAAGFAALLRGRPGLQVDGVFTHLATAEDTEATYARLQHAVFLRALQELAKAGLRPSVRHMANSAAALRFPEMRLDAVRPGLLVYGILPDAPALPALDLRPALTWKTRIAFARPLPAGCSISYARTYATKQQARLGVLPLGYADGFPRSASNRAQVLVRGILCPVVGTVCMDHVIVDLTPAGEVAAGEEVVLLGLQGPRRITANQLAAWGQTVVHQVPTVIGNRVARYYLGSETAVPGLTSGGEPV